MTYRLGKWKMVCDRCGGVYYNDEIREEWTGLMVCTRGCWEPRHPQDFVEGVEDDMTVPVVRPDVIQTQGETTLSGDALQWAATVDCTSISEMADGDPIGITLDNGATHWTYIDGTPAGSTVTLGTPLPWAAANGNTVYVPSINNETWSSN